MNKSNIELLSHKAKNNYLIIAIVVRWEIENKEF